MFRREGMTLMEIIIVLIMVAIAAVFFFPNFTTPMEHARATNAQNNLLAIYSAEQNYNNNNGSYLPLATLALVDSTLFLNIQDDGTYTYSCSAPPPAVTVPACTATRTHPLSSIIITATLNLPITKGTTPNPLCTPLSNNYNNWCP